MTDMALSVTPISHRLEGTSLLDDLLQLLRNHMARRELRRLLRGLSRISPRQLADMGFDPAEVRDAADGSWDEWHPHRMLRRALWAE